MQVLGLEPVSVDTTAQGEMQLALGTGLKDLQVRHAGVAELTLLQVLMSSCCIVCTRCRASIRLELASKHVEIHAQFRAF